MSKINRHPVRRTAAGVLAGTLALSGAVAAATPATALPSFGLERIAGEDRYETSARIAAEFGVTSGAILASGETGHVVDALSANFLAGVRQVPVLLTTRNNVPASVMARLNALTGEKRVTIVGETAAVSSAVETRLRSMGFQVDRLGGVNRFATSEEIIKAGATAASPIGLVASGTSFPDALAGGPLAYKGKHPVFLTSGGGLPRDTIDAMVAAGTRQVIILGGTSAVPASVEAALAARNISVVTRLGGAGRSETSRIIADYLIANMGFTNTTFNLASGVPRGEGADALSGAALSGKQNRALLITDNVTSANPVVNFARDRAATLNAVGNIFGGPAAVAVALEEAIEAAGRMSPGPVAVTSASVAQGGALTGTITGDFSSVTVSGCGFTNQTVGTDSDANTAGRQFSLTVPASQPTGACDVAFTFTPTGGGATTTQTVRVTVTQATSNQTLNVTPTEAAALPLADEAATATAGTDNRTYSASGLTNGTTYRITLVNSANITVGANGQVSFLSEADSGSSTGFSAVTGADVADITSVNNIATASNTNTVTVTPVNGNITFTIDGVAPGSVTPVLYINGGSGGTATTGGTSPRLEITATATALTGAPAETFGVGGATTFTARQAESGPIAAGTAVTGVDKAANTFTTGTGGDTRSLSYDANDLFRVGGISVGVDAFEAALSSGDVILANSSYTRDPAGISQFNLDNVNPSAATATASVGSGSASDDVTVTATFSSDVDQVVVQRATVTSGSVGTFVTVATAAATDTNATTSGTQISYVDANVALGSYQYRVAGINDGDQGEFGTPSNTVTTTAPAADTTPPTATDTRLTADNGFAGLLDAGDVFVVRLDEAAATPAAGAIIRVQDDEDTDSVADLINGTNATFSLNAAAIPATPTTNPNAGAAAGTVLTVTLTGAPTVVVAGSTPGVDIPATIVNTVGITDVAGNRLNVTAGERVIDVESAPTTDTTAPSFVSARGNAGLNTMTVTYSEALNTGSVSAADYTIRLSGGSSDISPTSATASGNTVTLTFGGSPFTQGLSGTLNKVDNQDVLDLANNDQADSDSVAFTTP